MAETREVDRRAEAEARRLLATAFETDALAGNGLAGSELLRAVRRRTARQRRVRALVPAGAVAALGGAAAVAVILTATVAGAPSAAAAVAAAAAKTSASSFRLTMKAVTTEPSSPGKGSTLVLPWGITGKYEPARGISEETITRPHAPTTQVIYAGQQMYVHTAGAQTAFVPGKGIERAKPWIELAIWPRQSATSVAVSPDFAQQSVNPTALLGLLKSVGTVTDEGPASGPHWTGTKYGFRVTAPKDTASASGTIDVDGAGQVRQMRITLTFAAGGGVNFTCVEDVTISDFGAPVSITVPPASQVDRLTGHAEVGLVPW